MREVDIMENKPKFCSECGAKLTGSAIFCPECGAKQQIAPAPAPTPAEAPENTLAATWNLAVDLHTAALLAQGRKQSAEEFLTRHPRFKLPAELTQMERNMVKRFAPQLLQK